MQVREVLRQASDTICKKLHNKNKLELTEDVESASKYTRRNAQYRTMAQNIIHHVTYYAVHHIEPEQKEISVTKIVYFKRSLKGEVVMSETIPEAFTAFKGFVTPINCVEIVNNKPHITQLYATMTIPSVIKEGLCAKTCSDYLMDNTKKSSHKEFHIDGKNKSNDWSVEMTQYIEENMSVYVKFAFDELTKNGKEYDAINLAIANHNAELGKLKSCQNNPEDVQRWENLQESKKMQQALLRMPSILFKLYQGMLLELDLEELLNMWIQTLESEHFDIKSECQIKLVRSLISDVCNSTYGRAEAEFQENILNNLVKNVRYNEVLTNLRDNAIRVKYFKFPINDSEGNDIDILHIKDFHKLAINREVIEYYHSSTQLFFNIKTLTSTTLLTVGMNGNVCIFDVLTLPTLDKSQLNEMCWSQRLNEAEKWLKNNNALKYQVVKVRPVSMVDIQYDLNPVTFYDNRQPLYLYYSTMGLGRGTKFVKVISNGKTKNPTPNPRQKKSNGAMGVINASPSIITRKYQHTNALCRLSDYYRGLTKTTITQNFAMDESEVDFIAPKRMKFRGQSNNSIQSSNTSIFSESVGDKYDSDDAMTILVDPDVFLANLDF